VNIVITMAGAGRRFRRAGYELPKFMIRARGRSLFAWSLSSLDNFLPVCERIIFVARKHDTAGPFIAAELGARSRPRVELVELSRPTDGQATSALAARATWEGAAPLLIYNIDTRVDPAWLRPAMIGGEGWIPCSRADGEHWSFVRVDDAGRAVEIREKERISDLASIGLYWFSSAELYETAYRTTYAAPGAAGVGERYIAPIYNALIADRLAVTVSEVPREAVTPLGTPEELARFEAAGR
jgi:choline kinase